MYLWRMSCGCVHFLTVMMCVQCVYCPTEVKYGMLVLVMVCVPEAEDSM